MNAFNDNKAGMTGLDKERIARVIAENTNSKYENFEQKRKQRIENRIERNHQKLLNVKESELIQAERIADDFLKLVETKRDLSRLIVHIDMDAFFAAVEMRDRPEFRNVPMAVGTDAMLSTSNYAARRYGVRSAMPGFIAKKLCPELKIVQSSFEKYRQESAMIKKIFEHYDANVRMGSLDEAYLDITDFMARRVEPVKLKRVRYISRENYGCICRLPLLSKTEQNCYINLLKNSEKCYFFETDLLNCEKENFTQGIQQNDLFNKKTSDNLNNQSDQNNKINDINTLKNLPLENITSTECQKNDTIDRCNFIFNTEKLCKKCKKLRFIIEDSVIFGTSVDDVVHEIRFKVEQATGLTCSAGIAANWMLAKVCSNEHKPNGQYRLPNEKDVILQFMDKLPIRKVSGIGQVTEALLKSSGVLNCGDLIRKRSILHILFSKLQFHWFMKVALGVQNTENSSTGEDDNDFLTKSSDRQTISTERTFAPTNNIEEIIEVCKQICLDLITDCVHRKVVGGQTVTIKIKFASFDVITRAKSVSYVVKSVNTLFPIAQTLVRKEMTFRGMPNVRLLGVRLSRLSFLNDSVKKREAIENLNNELLTTNSEQKTLTDFIKEQTLNPFKQYKKRNDKFMEVELIELSSSSSRSPSPLHMLKHSMKEKNFKEINQDKIVDTLKKKKKKIDVNKKEMFKKDNLLEIFLNKADKTVIDSKNKNVISINQISTEKEVDLERYELSGNEKNKNEESDECCVVIEENSKTQNNLNVNSNNLPKNETKNCKNLDEAKRKKVLNNVELVSNKNNSSKITYKKLTKKNSKILNCSKNDEKNTLNKYFPMVL